MEAFDAAVKEYQQLPFWGKIQFATQLDPLLTVYSMIRFDGCVRKKTDFAVIKESGECYVYLWKHMYGNVFYIGSGFGDRWTKLSGRNDDFYAHIDAGDAVAYKIIDGISKKESMLFERYISLSFHLAGKSTVNRDNRICGTVCDAEEEAAKMRKNLLAEEDVISVEDAILNKILMDRDFELGDVMARDRFLHDCGCRYFTQKYGRRTSC